MQVPIDQQSTIIITMPLAFQPKTPGKIRVNRAKNAFDLYFHIVLKLDCENFSQARSEKIQKYIIGYVRAKGADVEAIGIVGNRVHLLIALPQSRSLADFVREIKLVSALFAQRRLGFQDFVWQTDYDAFTVSLSQIERVFRYIRRQVKFQEQESYASSWQPVSFSRLF